MAPHVSENLSRLKKSSTELNKLADEATAHIKGLSDLLDKLSPGVDVHDSTSFASGREVNGSGHREPAYYTLAYARDDGGKYGLVVVAEVRETTEDEDGHAKPQKDEWGEDVYSTAWITRLDQVSRQLRIGAVARLPDFIALLAEKSEAAVSEVKGNLDKVREAAAEIGAALNSAPGIQPAGDFNASPTPSETRGKLAGPPVRQRPAPSIAEGSATGQRPHNQK